MKNLIVDLLEAEPSFSSILREIERWVLNDADPIRILTNIASLVGNQFRCDACSIYLLDPDTELLTLAGTVGLHQECVGEIRMARHEGLTGLVAQSGAPVVVRSAASQHPRFRYFPDAGEDLFDSFLGVPIQNASGMIGVLVLQTFETAEFTNEDVERMLDTGRRLGPELTPLITDAFANLSTALSD
ncbi:MAG: GAF domain-containing protein [Planctomycetaceae bacterium]